MFGHSRRNRSGQHVDPDLPITPMLDMSFQLLAFFIFTFRPAPTEGQILLALPKQEGSQTETAVPDSTEERPVKLTVTVNATGDGKIADITLRDEEAAGPAVKLGSDDKAYFTELKKRFEAAKPRPGKLTLELDERLLHEYVVKLLDEGVRAGFTDIAPVPTDVKKR